MDGNKLNAPQVNSWVDERMSALNCGEDWQPNVTAGFSRLQKLRRTANWIGRRTILLASATAAAVCLCIMAYPSPKVFARRCIAECTVVWQNPHYRRGRRRASLRKMRVTLRQILF